MTNDAGTVLAAQITSSAVVVFVWRYLEAKFPKLAALGPKAKRTIMWVVAAAKALGIHMTFSSSNAGEVLMIAIPTWGVLAHSAWDWIQSIATQEWIHRGTK